MVLPPASACFLLLFWVNTYRAYRAGKRKYDIWWEVHQERERARATRVRQIKEWLDDDNDECDTN